MTKGERVDCRCGHERRSVTSVMPQLQGEPRTFHHGCVCTASQDASAEACWNCRHGTHRRVTIKAAR